MASKRMMIGTGAALAGLGGIAAAAVVTTPDSEPAVATAAKPIVETRTVVVRTVEHRVKRVKVHHTRSASSQPSVAPAVAAPAPVVQAAAPVRVVATPVTNRQPIRTRTSGGGTGRGDDGSEHDTGMSNGGDDRAEHADD